MEGPPLERPNINAPKIGLMPFASNARHTVQTGSSDKGSCSVERPKVGEICPSGARARPLLGSFQIYVRRVPRAG